MILVRMHCSSPACGNRRARVHGTQAAEVRANASPYLLSSAACVQVAASWARWAANIAWGEFVWYEAPAPAVREGNDVVGGVDKRVANGRRLEVEELHAAGRDSLVVGAWVTTGQSREVRRLCELVHDRIDLVVVSRRRRKVVVSDESWQVSDA
jgi:hypothetical protein